MIGPNDDDNNTSTASADVVNAPCQFSTPENITVSVDAGQAGAVVTYATPTGTGDCGTPTTGENGETIPAISCNPASGSFFPVGTTHSLLLTAQTGAATSFQVTVDNPGALSISLNGAEYVDSGMRPAIRRSRRHSDRWFRSRVLKSQLATPVALILMRRLLEPILPLTRPLKARTLFRPLAPSMSPTLKAPRLRSTAQTHTGFNKAPARRLWIPALSAFDTCAGPKPVTTTISGPGGATSVNPAIAGTYTVTYTATDGTNQSTATRTVIVGTFPEDEVDQPGTSNVPPTITLNGDDQITLECGNSLYRSRRHRDSLRQPGDGNYIPGAVNPNAPGIYTLTYSASANGFTTEVTRIVTVEDTVAPVITLNGANPMVVGFGTVFHRSWCDCVGWMCG